MNATGKSDMKVYYEKIGQLQQTCLRLVLEKLLPVMEISAFGYYALDLELVFEPISNATLAERVTIISKLSAYVTNVGSEHRSGRTTLPESGAVVPPLPHSGRGRPGERRSKRNLNGRQFSLNGRFVFRHLALQLSV